MQTLELESIFHRWTDFSHSIFEFCAVSSNIRTLSVCRHSHHFCSERICQQKCN